MVPPIGCFIYIRYRIVLSGTVYISPDKMVLIITNGNGMKQARLKINVERCVKKCVIEDGHCL